MKKLLSPQFRSLRDFRRVIGTSALLIGVMVYCFNGLITQAHADSATLSISPPVVEILIAPDKIVNQTFNLEYTGSEVTIIPEIHRVKPSDSLGHVTIDPEPLNTSALSLVVTSTSHPLGVPITFTGGLLAITLSFQSARTDIPEDIYLALVLRATSSDLQSMTYDRRSTTTTPAISALILATVSPGFTPINLEIKDFTPPIIHDSWQPLIIDPSVDNKTPIMIRPEGKYEIISPFGKTAYSATLYPNLILGNSSRLLQGTEPCNNQNNNLQGSVPCKQTPLIWSPSWKDIGPYRLHLTLSTLGGTKLTDIEKTIWILPIRLLIVLTSVIIFAIALIKTTLKKNVTI